MKAEINAHGMLEARALHKNGLVLNKDGFKKPEELTDAADEEGQDLEKSMDLSTSCVGFSFFGKRQENKIISTLSKFGLHTYFKDLTITVLIILR